MSSSSDPHSEIVYEPEPDEDSPVSGWRVIKPTVTLNRGEAARQAEEEEAKRPVTFLTLAIRFLPVWALLIMILIIEPSLPVKAIGTMAGWFRGPEAPAAATLPPAEPVFIVEGMEIPPDSELPTPNWDLSISPIFTSEVQHWAGSVAQWSTTYRLKPNLIATLMQIESCGNPAAVSPAGASGLFQLMPLHFEEGEDPYDPDTNAYRGLTYFTEMYALANGDLGLAFAAYNGGPGAIYLSPAEWDAETQAYQYWGSGIYEEAELNLQQSPTLIEWLEAGGSDLCTVAAGALGLPPE